MEIARLEEEDTVTDRLDRDGPAALADDEVLAMLWDHVGDATVARRLIERGGGLRPLAAWTVPEFTSLTGIDRRRARALAAAFELGRRANSARVPRGAPLVSSLDVYRQFRPVLRDARREIFLVALLDVKNRLLREVRISEGSLSASLVHPREAFAPAVREPAHGVVFVHNHPSGDPTPSDEDAQLTKRLSAAGDVLGIRVLDHVVIGDDDYYSFADAGRMR